MRKQSASYPSIYHTYSNYDFKTTRIAFRKFKLSMVVELLLYEQNHLTITKYSKKKQQLHTWTWEVNPNFGQEFPSYWVTAQKRQDWQDWPSIQVPKRSVSVSLSTAPTSFLPIMHTTELIWLTVKVGMGTWKLIFQRCHLSDF